MTDLIVNPLENKQPKKQLPRTVGPQLLNRVVPWVEDFWHDKKRYPSESEFLCRYEIDAARLRDIHSSKLYRRALSARGINPGLTATNIPELEPKQIAAIAVLSNFSDTRNAEAKLASIDVSPEEYQGWLVNPEFVRRATQYADEIMANIYPGAMAAFAKKVQQGNVPALKMYFEATGRMKTPETVNLERAIQMIVEAVQRNVKDPEVLLKITAEMKLIFGYNQLESKPPVARAEGPIVMGE